MKKTGYNIILTDGKRREYLQAVFHSMREANDVAHQWAVKRNMTVLSVKHEELAGDRIQTPIL